MSNLTQTVTKYLAYETVGKPEIACGKEMACFKNRKKK
jgi:hypothetical protein